MPQRPPLCPAFAHSQSLTLSPILETVYSPLAPHEIQLFNGFEWTGLLSPPNSKHSTPQLGSTTTATSTGSSPSVPLLSRLDHLTLQYAKIAEKNGQSGKYQGGGSASVGKKGLGLDLDIKFSAHERRHSSVSTYTPPGSGSAYQRISDAFTAAAESRRRYSTSYEDFNYEEDDVDLSDAVAASYSSSSPTREEKMGENKMVKEHEGVGAMDVVTEREDNTGVTAPMGEGDLLPLHSWLQNRMEEAALREQFEAESDSAISTLIAPTSDIVTLPTSTTVLTSISSSSLASQGMEDGELPESATLVDIKTAVLQQRKVVKVNHKAVASLRSKASVLNTPPRKVSGEQQDRNGQEPTEDRDSPRASIFSPTAKAPSRSSIILSPATMNTKPFPTTSTAKPTHKRKASTVSERSSCLYSNYATNSTNSSLSNSKKIRRSSLSSLAFTSNALAPIFSSAFMRSMNVGGGNRDCIAGVDEFGKMEGGGGEKEIIGQGGEVKVKRTLQRTVSFLSRM